MSWIKDLALDLKPELGIWNWANFLVDEKKKVIVCTQYGGQDKVYIVGEDNKVNKVDFGVEVSLSLFNYVPSLTQIQQGND
ncbi:putative F-box protein [Cardamine amara subsp. amara]|uniref:F-box protein n=1 Tax=Cardamine amara subsp. amara TaxID=228776 RepID=A0ABD0ZIG4_CARAN